MRRESHGRIARLQDLVVETLYWVFPRAVLYGGTTIWRCYSENGFLEDLDVYLSRDPIDRLFEELEKVGFSVLKRRTTTASLSYSLAMENTEVRLKTLFKRSKGVVREYETCEGVLLNVLTLEPEEMVKEKVEAYLKRGWTGEAGRVPEEVREEVQGEGERGTWGIKRPHLRLKTNYHH